MPPSLEQGFEAKSLLSPRESLIVQVMVYERGAAHRWLFLGKRWSTSVEEEGFDTRGAKWREVTGFLSVLEGVNSYRLNWIHWYVPPPQLSLLSWWLRSPAYDG